jgi:hypothetical protein
MKLVRLSALRTGRLFPPGNIPDTHFCWRRPRPQDHSAAGRIILLKHFNDIGNRTRDLPSYSAVPQPYHSVTALHYYYYYYHHHHHHHPCYHLYAGYLQLYTWNTPCFYGIWCCSCSLFTVCAKCNVISPVKYVLYIYTSTSRCMCAVPNMAAVYISLISCFPDRLFRYCLNDFEMVPVAPIITGITFPFTFHMR